MSGYSLILSNIAMIFSSLLIITYYSRFTNFAIVIFIYILYTALETLSRGHAGSASAEFGIYIFRLQ